MHARAHSALGACQQESFLLACHRIQNAAQLHRSHSRLAATSILIFAWLQQSKEASLRPTAPLYKFLIVATSNILATTCQYEALRHISLPWQALCKASKMVPVMLWGMLISQKRYPGVSHELFRSSSLQNQACSRHVSHVPQVMSIKRPVMWDTRSRQMQLSGHQRAGPFIPAI